MRDRRRIECGQRYVKTNGLDREVWVVADLLRRPGLPLHVRLAKERRPGEMLSVSVDALAEGRIFRSVMGEA